MGKNWRGGRQGGHGRGRGGPGHDFASCRGHSLVLCSCDVVREREGSKELVNLLTQSIETLYPELLSEQGQGKVNASQSAHKESVKVDTTSSSSSSMSIQQLLQQEIEQVQNQSHEHTQLVVSVNTDIKGIILAKILPKHVSVIRLVEEIFNRIEREKKPISRYIVRMIPLEYSFFPREDEFLENCYLAMMAQYPGISLLSAKKMLQENKLKKLSVVEDKKVTASDAIICPSEGVAGDPLESIETEPPTVEINDTSDIKNEVEQPEITENQVDVEEDSSQPNKKRKLEHERSDDITSTKEAAEAIESTRTESTKIPDAQELSSVISTMGEDSHPIESVNYKSFTCDLAFKARNHNVLTKHSVLAHLQLCLPSFARLTYKDPQVLNVFAM